MKKIILSTICICIYASVLGQTTSLFREDLGQLIAEDNTHGSSRFNAMSGAFGALGGDISSISINPAGGAVALENVLSFTLANNTIKSTADFSGYGLDNKAIRNKLINLPNMNGAFIFSNTPRSNWERFALSFNYQQKSNFKNNFVVNGNYPMSYFKENPNENNDSPYDILDHQSLDRNASGSSSVFNIGFSGVRNENLYVGVNLNFHDFELHELVKLEEFSEDNNGNLLEGYNEQETDYKGSGFSLSVGGIYKIAKNIRIGLALETPTWYSEINDESNIFPQNDEDKRDVAYNGYTYIRTSDADNKNPITFETDNEFDAIYYSFRSHSRLTSSFAYIFGKQGLISIDYTFKNYSGMKFNDYQNSFTDVNRNFYEKFANTNNINIGTEWRFKMLSIRGGYHYRENSNTLQTKDKAVSGFSTGLGFTHKNVAFDLSFYQNKSKTFFHIYDINDLSFKNNNSRVSASITFNL